MPNEFEQLKKDVETIKVWMAQFQNASQLDPQVIRTITTILATSSTKSATSENQAVAEAGSATYNVLKPPDRFIRIGDNNVPAYD